MDRSVMSNMTTCWRWWWLLNCLNFLMLTVLLGSLHHAVASSEVQQKEPLIISTDNKSQLQEHFNFHPEYWSRLDEAIIYAKCVENEVLPKLDELSLIMRPGSCRKEPMASQRCNACIKEANQTMLHFAGFYQAVDPPKPLFHCTSHVGVDFKTHFRMEYATTNHHHYKTLRKEDLPRAFVVEKEVDGKWEVVTQHPFWLIDVKTKNHSTYRIRVTPVSPKHVYYPQLSEPVTLYDAHSLTTGTPINFRVVETVLNNKAARTAPELLLRWDSGSGLNASCDWDVYCLGEVETKIEQHLPDNAFYAILDRIQFEKTYSIHIIEKFGFGRESNPANLIVPVKSCLALVDNNFTLCAPPSPANIRIENETGSSFWIAWDGFYDENPKNQISHYNITADKILNGNTFRISEPLFTTAVPGNQTRVEVTNIAGPGSIKIMIVAWSNTTGKSKEEIVTRQLKGDVSWTKSLEQFWLVIVIVIILLMTILAIVYLKSFRDRLYRNRDKKKQWKKWDEEIPTPHTDRYSSKWEIDFGNLVLHDVVGKGQFGEVRKATLYRKGGKTTVAVKTLRVQPSSDTTSEENNETEDGSLAKNIIDKLFREEFEILKGISHTHVIGLVGIVREPAPALVMEFCDGGDLQSHLRKMAPIKVMDRKTPSMCPSMMGTAVQLQANAEVRVQLSMVTNEAYFIKNDMEYSLTPLDLLSYARQVACGMEFLSNNKIIHRDLAARNILISGSNRVLKIADFGLSRDVYEQNLYTKRSKEKIPVKWVAIECLLKEVYTTKSDVWSYGVLLWEILTLGGTPYCTIENEKMYDVLKDGLRLTRPDSCSRDLYDLMTQCWDENPDARPEFTLIRRKIEGLIANSGYAANYLNLDSAEIIQYSELMAPLRIYSEP